MYKKLIAEIPEYHNDNLKWIALTRTVNDVLKSSYTIDEIAAMDYHQLTAILSYNRMQ